MEILILLLIPDITCVKIVYTNYKGGNIMSINKKPKMIRLYPEDLKKLKELKSKLNCSSENEVIETGLKVLSIIYNIEKDVS